MPRPPRLEFPSALYHVTARGNERRALFRDDRDRDMYLARMSFYHRRFRFQLLAYCLMTNHVHLAIRTGPVPLSKIMAGLHASYAEWFNRRHRRVGHLFQGRYKAFLVQEDRYLHALIRYIHHNPVQAGLVKRARDYKWSSDRFLRRGRGPGWFDTDQVLGLLGESPGAAVRRYVELVDEPGGPTDEDLPVVKQVVVGDSDYAVELLEASGEHEPTLPTLSLDDVLKLVSRETGVPLAVLVSHRRNRPAAAARCLTAYLAHRVGRISVRQVARRFGRDDSVFVRPLARLERELTRDGDRRRRVDGLVRALRRSVMIAPARPDPGNKSESQD
jgi:REP element-mobilizing transposase RayT